VRTDALETCTCMTTFRATVYEILLATCELSRGFTVWWMLTDQKSIQGHDAAFKTCPAFFNTVREALFQEIFVITCQLFDSDPQTKSIPNVIIELETSNPSVAHHLQTEADKLQPILRAMRIVRHNVYAHRNRGLLAEEFFKKANLSKRKVETAIQTTKAIVTKLAEIAEWGPKISDYEDAARSDTWNLLEILQSSEK